MKTWIKMTDRAPTETDLPVWAYFSNDKSDRGPHLFDGFPAIVEFTHWRPAKDDVPEPPREETQSDREEKLRGALDGAREALDRLTAWGMYQPEWASDKDKPCYKADFMKATEALARIDELSK